MKLKTSYKLNGFYFNSPEYVVKYDLKNVDYSFYEYLTKTKIKEIKSNVDLTFEFLWVRDIGCISVILSEAKFTVNPDLYYCVSDFNEHYHKDGNLFDFCNKLKDDFNNGANVDSPEYWIKAIKEAVKNEGLCNINE